MLFLSPHLPGLLPIVCDGQHRPVRRWPLFGRVGGVHCDGSKSLNFKSMRSPYKGRGTHHSASVRSRCGGSSDRSFMVDPLSYFSFQLVLQDWCNKGSGMCYPVYGMVHIKEPLLLIGKYQTNGAVAMSSVNGG